MRLIKIGIGNVNPTVGAFRKNVDHIVAQARAMAAQGCQIAVFGELSISGYPCEDLVQWASFVDQQGVELERLARELNTEKTSTMAVVVGLTVPLDGNLYNVAALIAQGQVVGLVPKENLPDYNVFYEGRTVTPGMIGMHETLGEIRIGDMIFELGFGKMALEVCEDIWRSDGPMVRRAFSGAELIVNISASPFRIGVVDTRREMIATRACDNTATVVYVNLVGAQDALVFDGGGYVNQCGRMMLEVTRGHVGFETCVVDLDRVRRVRNENTTWRRSRQQFLTSHKAVPLVSDPGLHEVARPNNDLPYPVPAHKNFFLPKPEEKPVSARERYFQDLTMVIAMATWDYFEKSGAFKRFLIALSGGKDSCLTLLLAHRAVCGQADRRGLEGESRAAFVKDMIWCVDMPSRHNSMDTRGITEKICEELGVTLVVSPIQQAVEKEREALKATLCVEMLGRQVEQNIQARVRGERMWNLTNELGGLWLQTSNMSEKAVGYTTIGGDMMGTYGLIANLPKTVVIEFIRWWYEKTGLWVLSVLDTTTASAELEANQSDEADLMPFPVLDACFALFVGEKMTIQEVRHVIQQMWPEEPRIPEWVDRFARLFLNSIFKWVQTPLAVHLGGLDLDRERALQLPVIQDRSWLQE
ncbi:NAD(+) synthase [Candidatus Uhrbacteria bacterium]|nr:NAD(+) synthase [Candidatus Uhrbacteria bacterium]